MELTISQVRGREHDRHGDWALDLRMEPCPRLSRFLPQAAVGATETTLFWVLCQAWHTPLAIGPLCPETLLRIDASLQGLHPEEGSEEPVVLPSISLDTIS